VTILFAFDAFLLEISGS